VRGQPHAGLRGHVLCYSGWREHSATLVSRVEVPWAGAVAIICFGVPYRLDGESFGTFVGGLSDRPILTQFVGDAAGVQVDFTPLGARRCIGLPMDELTNRVVALEDVLGRGAHELVGRLQEAAGWRERFALLDAALLRRVAAGPEPAPEVTWTYRRLAAAGGRLAVGPLADEVGWSRRHLAARFRRDVGMGPKAVARLLRFERAMRLLREGRGIADVAYDCGFADQPHLNREFRALAGSTPGEVTFVQDPVELAG
jgi:AraC-like DNA-binding protein